MQAVAGPGGVWATLETYLVSRGSAQRSYAYSVAANLAVLGLLPPMGGARQGGAGACWSQAC